jgi:hypothetical protein
MRTRVMFMALAAMSVMIAACEDDDDDDVTFSATLNGAGERPAAVTTGGTGTFTGSLDPVTNILTYNVTWTGLGSASNNAHIHGPITVGSTAAAGVLVDFNAAASGRTITHGTSGSATGTINFTTIVPTATVSADSLRKLFDNGAIYVNVHSVNFPGGEIAGIITRQ